VVGIQFGGWAKCTLKKCPGTERQLARTDDQMGLEEAVTDRSTKAVYKLQLEKGAGVLVYSLLGSGYSSAKEDTRTEAFPNSLGEVGNPRGLWMALAPPPISESFLESARTLLLRRPR